MIRQLKFSVVVIGLFLAEGALQSAMAGGLKEVQSALDRLYPGWTARNVGTITGYGTRDCGLHDGVISVHPLSRTVPATLTRVGLIAGKHPVLHLRVSSVGDDTRSGDWMLRIRVNGRPACGEVLIASTAVRDFKLPLAPWANRGAVKIELDTSAGGDDVWNWELGFWHLIEIIEDASAYGVSATERRTR